MPAAGAGSKSNPLPEYAEGFSKLLAPGNGIRGFLENDYRILVSIYIRLGYKLIKCIEAVDDSLPLPMNEEPLEQWSHYLILLRHLHYITVLLYGPKNEKFKISLRYSANGFRYLVKEYSKRGDDLSWLLHYKELLDFECRKHIVMMLLPPVSSYTPPEHAWVISRKKLLEDSFFLVSTMEPEVLRGRIYVAFDNEEATGSGVALPCLQATLSS